MKCEDYKFSKSGLYYVPKPGEKHEYLEYINNLPNSTVPEIFGLHNNAEITTAQNEASDLLECVLSLQPRTSSSGGKTWDETMSEILIAVLDKTPKEIDYEEVFKKYPKLYGESMNTVLIQEIIRYNVLLNVMAKSLKNLSKALSGVIVMSDDTERIANSLYINQIPAVWLKFGFLSLKPLMAWMEDLGGRIKFLLDWVENGTPKAFCLPSKLY